MNVQKFVDILDESDITAVEFFKQHGKYIFTDDRLLLALMKEKWSEKKYRKCLTLAWIVGLGLGSGRFEEKKYFDILSVYRYFYRYMFSGCKFFGGIRIPFEEWEDLAKEQVDNLKILIEKNQLKSFKRTKLDREFGKKYLERLDYFRKKGYIHPCYFEGPSGL